MNALAEGALFSRKGAGAKHMGAPCREQAWLREAGKCRERWHLTQWAESWARGRWWGLEGGGGSLSARAWRWGLISEVWELWVSKGVPWPGLSV